MGRDFINPQIQLNSMLLAIAAGAVLGVLYDAFRIVRLSFSSKKIATVVLDVLFWLTAGIISFFFAFAVDNGRFRWYFAAGEMLGFFAYYFTLGLAVMRVSGWIVKLLKKLFKGIIKVLLFPFKKIYLVLSPKFINLSKMTKKKSKISTTKCKFILKRNKIMLYNEKVSK